MEWDFDLLTDENILEAKRLINEYSMFIGKQRVGIKIYIDADGYYQMRTSHYYQGKDKASAYTTSSTSFESEREALSRAKNQLLSFYDGQGRWHENESYHL